MTDEEELKVITERAKILSKFGNSPPEGHDVSDLFKQAHSDRWTLIGIISRLKEAPE